MSTKSKRPTLRLRNVTNKDYHHQLPTDRRMDDYQIGRLKTMVLAASAGLCGSSAGTLGKIGVHIDELLGDEGLLSISLVRILLMVLVLLANIGVWLLYTKSMRFGSSLVSTGISIATNYIVTALTGVLLFSESCSLLWACGTLSVITGVFLMSI